ncbi:MAG: type II secretion system protein [Candidatus Pacebacteria bacterium]|nr:type II secretion system protein [Candidatus Paceibacterota bacterium]MBP9842664.1 type II secretion system protein [Candidatus Paceibacterota bacterium]
MKYASSQSGFTLVETLVAITILLIVMIGPMTISSQTAKSSTFASEQVTAFFLAQEGVELAQKARDDLLVRSFASNAIASELTPWATFTNTSAGQYSHCYDAVEGCGLEILIHNGLGGNDISTPIDCGSLAAAKPQVCHLWYAPSNVRSKFTHTASGNTQTPFNRRIYLTRVNADEVLVRSVVTWQSGNIRNEQRVEVESRLFNLYGS